MTKNNEKKKWKISRCQNYGDYYLTERTNNDQNNEKKKWKISTCASCEYTYLRRRPCPKCGFVYYSATFVYGGLIGAIKALILQKGYRLRK